MLPAFPYRIQWPTNYRGNFYGTYVILIAILWINGGNYSRTLMNLSQIMAKFFFILTLILSDKEIFDFFVQVLGYASYNLHVWL